MRIGTTKANNSYSKTPKTVSGISKLILHSRKATDRNNAQVGPKA